MKLDRARTLSAVAAILIAAIALGTCAYKAVDPFQSAQLEPPAPATRLVATRSTELVSSSVEPLPTMVGRSTASSSTTADATPEPTSTSTTSTNTSSPTSTSTSTTGSTSSTSSSSTSTTLLPKRFSFGEPCDTEGATALEHDGTPITCSPNRCDGSTYGGATKWQETACFDTTTTTTTSTTAPPGPDDPTRRVATVTWVKDGDTVVIEDDEQIRFIGMDTPERDECGSDAAKDRVLALIPVGSTIELEFDSDPVDRYGRTLAYVWSDGQMLNELLIDEGLAIAFPYEPNYRYRQLFESGSKAAQAAGTGTWAVCPDDMSDLYDDRNRY